MKKLISDIIHVWYYEILKKVEQSPWYKGEDDFVTEYLNKLKEYAYFMCNVIDNVDSNY